MSNQCYFACRRFYIYDSNPYSCFLPLQILVWESYNEGRRRTNSGHYPAPSHLSISSSNLPKIPKCKFYHSINSNITRRPVLYFFSVTWIPYIFSLLIIGLNFREISGAKLSGTGLRQRFANQPSPQTAVIGSTVVLPCRVINMVGELQWTRDDFGLGNERELLAFKRYKMIGSHEEGKNIHIFVICNTNIFLTL